MDESPYSHPAKPSKDRPDIQVFDAYLEADHDRSIQKNFFQIIMPLYFITLCVAMFTLKEGQYESTLTWLSYLVIAVFVFAFQSKIKAILVKLLVH